MSAHQPAHPGLLRGYNNIDIEIPPRIVIWAGLKKYEFGVSHFWENWKVISYVTAPEIDWIAHELSDWLGLPITRE